MLSLSLYLILNHQVLRLLRLCLYDHLLQSPLLRLLHPIDHHFLNLKCHQLRNLVCPLADKMTSVISLLGLDLQNLRGQGYDGAGNTSGKMNVAAAIISSSYPLAVYHHCASHMLNLPVVKSLDVPCVCNIIGVVNKVSMFFFAQPKRQRKLEEVINEMQPSSRVNKLKDLCRTRWIERISRCLGAIQTPTPFSCVCALRQFRSSEGSTSWSADSLTDASTLLLAITTTEFVSALVIASKSLSYLHSLTTSLQAEAKDIVQAIKEVDTLKRTISNIRDDVETYHGQFFEEMEKMCQCVGTQPSLPCRCGRQTHRSNVPAQSPSEYYQCTATIPILDLLISEIEHRFSSHQKTALLGLHMMPSILITSRLQDVVEKLAPLEEMYANDLVNGNFSSELHQWYMKWESLRNEHGIDALPTSLSHTLPHASSYYANIRILLQVLCALP